MNEPESRAPQVERIEVTSREIPTSTGATIIEIVIAGEYPPGDLGEAHAREIIRASTAIVARFSPAAVLLNFEGLDYTRGKAMQELWALGVGSYEERMAMPSCAYAKGRTKDALEWLFEPGMICAQLKIPLIGDREEAIRHLEQRFG